MSEDKWTVNKLDGSNWTTWKFQMQHFLLAKGLWGHVDETDVLASGASEAVRTEFKQKAQRAFSTIVMAVSTPQLYLVTACNEPKEVWDKLSDHFECETLANKLFLKKIFSYGNERGHAYGTTLEGHERDHRQTRVHWVTYL